MANKQRINAPGVVATYREVLPVAVGQCSSTLEAHAHALAQSEHLAPIVSHVCATRSIDGAHLSLAYGPGPDALLGETVVASLNTPVGCWVGMLNNTLYAVQWDDALVTWEAGDITVDQVAARLSDNHDEHRGDRSLFCTGLSDPEREACFGLAAVKVIELTHSPVMLRPITSAINTLQRMEGRSRRRWASVGVLVLASLGFLGVSLVPEATTVPPVVTVAPSGAEHALASYQSALHGPDPQVLITQLQQATWRAQTLGGWTLEAVRFTSGEGIALELSNDLPSQAYLHRWVDSQPFEVSASDTPSSITLVWTPPLVSRIPPAAIPASRATHLDLMDAISAMGWDYTSRPAMDTHPDYAVHDLSLSIPQPQMQVFEVLGWLVQQHRDCVVQALSLTHERGSWQGTVSLRVIEGRRSIEVDTPSLTQEYTYAYRS